MSPYRTPVTPEPDPAPRPQLAMSDWSKMALAMLVGVPLLLILSVCCVWAFDRSETLVWAAKGLLYIATGAIMVGGLAWFAVGLAVALWSLFRHWYRLLRWRLSR